MIYYVVLDVVDTTTKLGHLQNFPRGEKGSKWFPIGSMYTVATFIDLSHAELYGSMFVISWVISQTH